MLYACLWCIISLVHKLTICRDYSKTYARSKYYDEAKPWSERCDVAFACASHNEIDQSDAINLVNSGCRILVEGSCSSKFPHIWLSPSSSFSYILTKLLVQFKYQVQTCLVPLRQFRFSEKLVFSLLLQWLLVLEG